MIRKQDILDRALEWQLRPNVVEKDYVLGWILAAIGVHPVTSEAWIFKGGTCLKKCFFETYRFSEDLDFSLMPAAPYIAADLLRVLREVTEEVTERSGIRFPVDTITIRERTDKLGRLTFEGKVGYVGPLAYPGPPRILFDLTHHEPILDPVVRRPVFHPYPDELSGEGTVATYSLNELFAEKTRALMERSRPRDLYDVVHILDNRADALDMPTARRLFHGKCSVKGLAPPSAGALLVIVENQPELRSEWENMLGHQLPILPPLEPLMERLPQVLGWLDETAPFPVRPPVASIPADQERVAPAGIRYWNSSVPVESIRFAGSNRLLLEFEYHGARRIVEPYSFRRGAMGNLLLYAFELASGQIKAFNVSKIGNLGVTRRTFVPRYQIEFFETGPLVAPAVRPGVRSSRRSSLSLAPKYVYKCIECGREFRHKRRNARLGSHKDRSGDPCPGRRGEFLGEVD